MKKIVMNKAIRGGNFCLSYVIRDELLPFAKGQ